MCILQSNLDVLDSKQQGEREQLAIEQITQETEHGRREGIMLGCSEKEGKKYVPESKDNSRRKEREENGTERGKGKKNGCRGSN